VGRWSGTGPGHESFHKLKYPFAATCFDQIRLALPKLVKEKSATSRRSQIIDGRWKVVSDYVKP
jgi:hypothetical protein